MFIAKSMRSNRKKNKKSDDNSTKNKKKTSVTKKSERVKKGSKAKCSARSERKKSSASSADSSQKPKKTTPAKEPWTGEDAAKKLVASGVFNETTIANEFKTLASPKPSAADSGVFQSNLAKNRLKEFPISNEKLVKFTAPPNNYVSAARLTIAEGKRMIVAQLPEPTNAGQVEDLWRMVFQEECLSVVLCSTPAELADLQKLFPTGANTFANTGKMFLQTRKVDKDSSPIHSFQLELLPDGCSNSINTNVYHVANWPKKKGPDGYGPLVTTLEKILKTNANVCLVSHSGVGRAGILAVLMAVMVQMEGAGGQMPKIKEIVEKLRGERSGLVESVEQYSAIYKAIGWWIKQKASDEEMIKKLGDFVPKA